jgi:hypothetical protein
MLIISYGQAFFVHMSEVKRVEFVSDRISYIILRGCRCDIVLNVCAPTEVMIQRIAFVRTYKYRMYLINS